MSDESAAERLRIALDLYEVGERMQRMRLRREQPAASDVDIDAAIQRWLRSRPDAPLGDATGSPSSRFS